jgi:serine/threonine-protein kinase
MFDPPFPSRRRKSGLSPRSGGCFPDSRQLLDTVDSSYSMEKLGHYEILGELGRGGCGVVYRAFDPAIGRTVAIKTILTGGSGDASKERFRREARSAGSLSHPNIVTIHEFDDSGDVMFIAMEYIDGQTLAERMSQPKLPIPFVLATVRSASDALDFAHASNIVHRDVKPANFLITKQGHLKITDFGIAKVMDSDTNLTNTGMVIGTVQYMSPEQIASQEITGRSDQFSLAVITYEMLTGQRPFQGNSWASVIHSIMSTEPPPLNQHREELGEAVTAVLRKALAKDPQARYTTCREFSDALERSVLGATAEQRVFWEKADVTQLLPAGDLGETVVMTKATGGPTTTKEKAVAPLPSTSQPVALSVAKPVVQPVAPRRLWVMPLATAVVVAIGLGSWMVLHRSRSQDAGAVPAQPVSAVSPGSGTPAPVSSQAQPTLESPAPKSSPEPARGAKVERPSPPPLSPGKQSSSPAAVPATPAATPAASAPPQQPTEAAPPPATPAPSRTVPPPSQSAPVTRQVEPPPTPAATPAPVAPAAIPAATPARGPDPAQVAAQRHAAELQGVSRAIADAVAQYRQAFEARDLNGLKAVWPGLGRNEQTSFQNFFRIARTVKLQMTPIGEPEITASGATAQYRRAISASDERRALPTQDQTVKVTFRKSGDRMFIDAIEAVGR